MIPRARSSLQFPSPRWQRSLLFLLASLVAPVAGLGQTFLAEWTASADGGIAPVGLALATENNVT